jgi:hypothetical protein
MSDVCARQHRIAKGALTDVPVHLSSENPLIRAEEAEVQRLAQLSRNNKKILLQCLALPKTRHSSFRL